MKKEKKETLSLCIAVILGSAMGGSIGIQWGGFFALLGTAIGALLAWGTYQFPKLVQAVPVAFKRATSWRPNSDKLWYYTYTLIAGLLLPSGLILLQAFKGGPLFYLHLQPRPMDASWVIPVILHVTILIIVMLLAIELRPNDYTKGRKYARNIAIFTIPPICVLVSSAAVLAVVLAMVYVIGKGVCWLGLHLLHSAVIRIQWFPHDVTTFGRFLVRFGRELFLLVHSENRLIALVGGAVGAGTSYLAQSLIIGTSIGLGVALFSRFVIRARWLEPRGYLPLRL